MKSTAPTVTSVMPLWERGSDFVSGADIVGVMIAVIVVITVAVVAVVAAAASKVLAIETASLLLQHVVFW